jgi:hypothetical protein
MLALEARSQVFTVVITLSVMITIIFHVLSARLKKYPAQNMNKKDRFVRDQNEVETGFSKWTLLLVGPKKYKRFFGNASSSEYGEI